MTDENPIQEYVTREELKELIHTLNKGLELRDQSNKLLQQQIESNQRILHRRGKWVGRGRGLGVQPGEWPARGRRPDGVHQLRGQLAQRFAHHVVERTLPVSVRTQVQVQGQRDQ